jgi:type VI secretion system protein ImpH
VSEAALDAALEAAPPGPDRSSATLAAMGQTGRHRVAAEGVHSASPLERLTAAPGLFSLDQAAWVAAGGEGPLALRYRTVTRLGFAVGEVVAFRPESRELVVSNFGLIGPGGVLPRHFTATAAAELRKRSRALHEFLDMLGGRFAGLHVHAGARYRPARDPDPAERVLAAAMGLETPGLVERVGVPRDTSLYHAGHLSARSRSATRLTAMLEEETGWPVQIEEFAGGWMRLPPEERTRIIGQARDGLAQGQHARLGEGALIGVQSWDPQARFVVRIGPVHRRAFDLLLPGQPLHTRLVSLIRLFVGLDSAFAIAPVLEPAAIGSLRLGGTDARLGWSAWLSLPRGRARRLPGSEPCFEPRSGSAPGSLRKGPGIDPFRHARA